MCHDRAVTDASRRGLGRVFDEVPDLYDRVRPAYPDALFADLVSISGIDDPASMVDHHPGGAHPYRIQHGDQQRSLVLAVAITVFEDIGRRVGLISADADFNAYIADLTLHEPRHALDLAFEIGRVRGNLSRLGRDLLRRFCAWSSEVVIPVADLSPSLLACR